MMRRISFRRQLLTGALLGFLLLNLSAPRAEAQWLTFDKPNWLLKLEEMMREVDRWEQTIAHYGQMFDKAVQQVTHLSNILKTADEILSRNKSLVVTIASLGQMIRHSFQLKNQIENMVHSRIISIEHLWGRFRQGIFDPEQDMRDLEEYLEDSIGQSSEDTVRRMQRLSTLDNEFERMRYELQQAMIRREHAQEVLIQYQNALDAEMVKPEHERLAVDSLQHQITLWTQILEQLNKQIEDLMTQITARAARYGMVIRQRADFGSQILNTNDGFGAIIEGKKEILDEIDEEFEPDEGIVDDEEWF